MSVEIPITVNGKPGVVDSGWSIDSLLAAKHLNPACVVVELNNNIVQKENYGSAVLAPNDSIEILHFVGGG
jgi:sulfur carrier protein